MLYFSSRRVNLIIGVGLFVGLSVFRMPDARAQDANTASVAELQQRVQELEAVVQQMSDRDPNVALAQPVSAPADVGRYPATQVAAGGNRVRSGRSAGGWQSGAGDREQRRTRISQAGITAFSCSRPIGRANCGSRARLQADYRGFLDPSIRPPPIRPRREPTTGSPDSFLIRRARLGIEATMANYYEFRLLPDFAGTTVSKSITDAYMNVHYWDQFQFEIGKFKQPFSYEDLIQDRYVPTDGTLDDGSALPATR